jgi:hypothetical protein
MSHLRLRTASASRRLLADGHEDCRRAFVKLSALYAKKHSSASSTSFDAKKRKNSADVKVDVERRQGRQCTYKCNTQPLSRNHCCRANAISLKPRPHLRTMSADSPCTLSADSVRGLFTYTSCTAFCVHTVRVHCRQTVYADCSRTVRVQRFVSTQSVYLVGRQCTRTVHVQFVYSVLCPHSPCTLSADSVRGLFTYNSCTVFCVHT